MAIKKSNFGSNQISDKQVTKEEEVFELNLRPKSLNDYVGQEKLKSNLKVFIEAAKGREEPLEHLLFYGPPGLGKTSLSNVIANEMGVSIKTTSGPAITKAGDLAAILTSLKKGDILFIDEIHRLKTNVEEILYSAMEDYKINIVMGKGPGARSMRLNIPPFTLIGATTKAGSLSAPLRDRFGDIARLEFYTDLEMQKILKRSAEILNLQIDKASLEKISLCSRFTPRIANRILRRLRDFAQLHNDSFLDLKVTNHGLEALGIESSGLDFNDKNYLKTLVEKFDGGPVGISTLAASLHEEKDTIEEVLEPFLIQNGYIQRTSKGRIATKKTYDYLT